MATNLYVNYLGQTDITLGADTTNSDTSWTVTVPTILASFGIVNPSGVGIYKCLVGTEIVHFIAGLVTAGTQTWTVARAQEGTTGAVHTSGTVIKLDPTADALANAVQLSPTAQQTGAVNVSGSVTGGSLAVPHASTHDVGGSDVLKDLTRLAAGPSIQGYTAWNVDSAPLLSAVGPSAGVVYLMKIMTAHAFTISTIDLGLKQGGSGATALANCFLGIYDSGGTRRFASADQSSAWATSGAKSLALGGSAYTTTANDFVYIAILIGTQATTPAQIYGASGFANANFGLTAATYRFATNSTSLTALPNPTITLSNNLSSGVEFSIGVK